MPVYARLVGGLGNQLFQYANGFAQSQRLGVPLMLDTRELSATKTAHNVFALDQFKISATVGTSTVLPPPRTSRLRYAAWRKFGRNPKHFREQGFAFNSKIMDATDNTYFHGYFLSDKYFVASQNALRNELQFALEPNLENAKWATKIQNTCSVALHMRRGDFVGTSAGGICDEAYYRRAISHMNSAIQGDFELFVFSNDPEWVRQNIDFGRPMHVMSHNNAQAAVDDLRLMAACDHQIIANSSMSWWGAWLNNSDDKIVVAPKTWYPEKKFSKLEIIPTDWVKV